MSEEGDDTRDDFHATVLRWYSEFHDATRENREAAEKDRDYYDNHQWTDEEIAVLNERLQPVITVNRIAPKINYVLGAEIKNRVDPKAYARTPVHEDDAHVATDGLRYVSDRENFDKKRSKTMKGLLTEGVGGVVVEPETVMVNGEKRVEVSIRRLNYNRIWYDHHSIEPDFSDARYLGVVVWRDYNDALGDPQYKGKKRILEETAANRNSDLSDDTSQGDTPSTWFDTTRQRIKITEVYYQKEDAWWVAHATNAGFVIPPKELKVKTDRGIGFCPLILGTGNVDRKGNRYGIIRALISLQDEVNKRRSKALHEMTQTRVVAETGAVLEPDTFQQELSKADGYAEVTPGALVNKRFEILPPKDIEHQIGLMQDAKADLDTIGPHAALIAADQRQTSGRAFLARQEAGTLEIEPVMENLRDWTLRAYEACWYHIRALWPEERWLRVRDDEDKKGYRYVQVNRKMTKGERVEELAKKGMPLNQAVQTVMGVDGAKSFMTIAQDVQQEVQAVAQHVQVRDDPAAMQEKSMKRLKETKLAKERFTANDVAQLDVDIILEAAPAVAVIQHEEYQELIDLAKSGMVQIPPEAVLEASSLRNKRKIIAMMQESNKAASEAQAQQTQMQTEQLKAAIEKLTAEAALAGARAAKEQAVAQIQIPAEAQRDAAQSAKLGAEGEKEQAVAKVAIPAAAEKDKAAASKMDGEAGILPSVDTKNKAQAVKAFADARASGTPKPGEKK